MRCIDINILNGRNENKNNFIEETTHLNVTTALYVENLLFVVVFYVNKKRKKEKRENKEYPYEQVHICKI